MENKTGSLLECDSNLGCTKTRDKLMELLDWGLTHEDKTKAVNHIIKNKDNIMALVLE